jgi:long-chain acyl-CoA synthetase
MEYETLVELLESSCSKFKDRELFGTKHGSEWRWTTYGRFHELVEACSAGLVARGIGPGDRVGIVADNCVEWATSAHATYRAGGIFVPMYTAQRPDEWKFILNDCNAKLVIAASEAAYQKLKAAQPEMPTVKQVIGLSLPEAHEDSYAALLAQGKAAPVPKARVSSSDLAAFIYTSGTTGQPKGVKLSHKNLCSNLAAIEAVIPMKHERSLAFLPWAHSFGHTAELQYFIQRGFSLAINDDVTRLVSNLAEVHPTVLVAVPRIFNRIYEGVHRQMAAKPGIIQALFRHGLRAGGAKAAGKALGLGDRVLLALADRLIFSKVRAKFGGKLELVICGSAALNKEVAEFVAGLGIVIYEGYGLTETSPVVSVNCAAGSRIGSVGRPVPGVRVVLDESQSTQPGEGEVIVYGPNVMQGYHQRPEDDAAIFTKDGGLRTGDLGKLDRDGFLYITGRSKELYKLENGKYVAPAPLEEELKVSPYIANVVIYGSDRPHNVALVVPNQDRLKEWAAESGVELGNITQNPKVRELLMGEIQSHSHGFKSYERPRSIAVITEDFTTENGLLTPKMSVKRKEVLSRYGSALDALYSA